MKQFLVTMITMSLAGKTHAEDPINIDAYSPEDAIIQAVQQRKSERIRVTYRGDATDPLWKVHVYRVGLEEDKG